MGVLKNETSQQSTQRLGGDHFNRLIYKIIINKDIRNIIFITYCIIFLNGLYNRNYTNIYLYDIL